MNGGVQLLACVDSGEDLLASLSEKSRASAPISDSVHFLHLAPTRRYLFVSPLESRLLLHNKRLPAHSSFCTITPLLPAQIIISLPSSNERVPDRLALRANPGVFGLRSVSFLRDDPIQQNRQEFSGKGITALQEGTSWARLKENLQGKVRRIRRHRNGPGQTL
jgi:hypothetical protein